MPYDVADTTKTSCQFFSFLISKPMDSRRVHRSTTFRLSPSNSNYWPAFPSSFQIPTLERVRASAFTCHPHPPVQDIKVVKSDWDICSTSTSTVSEPSFKATWLGHPVRLQVVLSSFTPTPLLAYIKVSSSSSRASQPAHKADPLASCSTPSSRTALACLLGWASDAACLLLAQ